MLSSQERKHREKQILLLQQSLSSIRKIAGWTTSELGEKIGVSKQTISNLENNKSAMSFTQYIAIRSVLDCEIEEHPENTILPKAIQLLLDHEEELTEADYNQIKMSIDTVAATAAGGADNKELEHVFSSILPTIMLGVGCSIASPIFALGQMSSAIVGSYWLKKIAKKKKKESKLDAKNNTMQ